MGEEVKEAAVVLEAALPEVPTVAGKPLALSFPLNHSSLVGQHVVISY